MSWYIEFEVEDENEEKEFWRCIEQIGMYAERFAKDGNWTDLVDMEEAAFDLAKLMGYNV